MSIAVCGLLLVLISESTDQRGVKQDVRSTPTIEPASTPLASPLVQQLTAEAWVAHQALAIHLLGQTWVVDELKVTDRQQMVIRAIATDGLQIVGRNRGLVFGDGETQDRWSAFIHSVEPLADQVDDKLRDTLDPRQYERLTQITLQTYCDPFGIVEAGPIVFLQPPVTELIRLTSEQRQAVAEQTERTRAQIAGSGAVGRLFAVERTRRLLCEGRQQAERLLAPDQLAKWQRLQGPSVPQSRE